MNAVTVGKAKTWKIGTGYWVLGAACRVEELNHHTLKFSTLLHVYPQICLSCRYQYPARWAKPESSEVGPVLSFLFPLDRVRRPNLSGFYDAVVLLFGYRDYD
jgi:hypothetical protein